MVSWLIRQQVDLDNPYASTYAGNMATWQQYMHGDNRAHTWQIVVTKNGVAANLSGYTANAYFVRKDKQSVLIQGTIRGNTIEYVLTQECYAVPGSVTGVARLANGHGVVMSLPPIEIVVKNGITDGIIDPGAVVPSIDGLLALIGETREARDGADTATTRANTGADTANTAAERAEDVTGRITAQLPIIEQNVSDALEAATQAGAARDDAKQSQAASAQSEISAAASAERAGEFAALVESNFQIPAFDLDANGHIVQISASIDGYLFTINQSGHMEMIYNA